MILIFFSVFLIVVLGIENICCNVVIEGLSVEALASTIIPISGATVHFFFLMLYIRSKYLFVYVVTLFYENS